MRTLLFGNYLGCVGVALTSTLSIAAAAEAQSATNPVQLVQPTPINVPVSRPVPVRTDNMRPSPIPTVNVRPATNIPHAQFPVTPVPVTPRVPDLSARPSGRPGSNGGNTGNSSGNNNNNNSNNNNSLNSLVNVIEQAFVCDGTQTGGAEATFTNNPATQSLALTLTALSQGASAGVNFLNVTNLPAETFSITTSGQLLPPGSTVTTNISAQPVLNVTFRAPGESKFNSVVLQPSTVSQSNTGQTTFVYNLLTNGTIPQGSKLSQLFLTLSALPNGGVNSITILSASINNSLVTNSSLVQQSCPAFGGNVTASR